MSASIGQTNRFSKNENLESLLGRLNSLLERAEKCIPVDDDQAHPLVVLVGAPRSGTTLAMQWLGSTGIAEVPTNLLSRFYRAPAVGLMIQKMLTDPQYQYRDEMSLGSDTACDFRSDLGKTSGIKNHNSFFYFWRHFQPQLGLKPLTHEQRGNFDTRELRSSVSRLTREASRPFAIKGLLMQYDLDLVQGAVRDILFMHLTRDPIANMKSLLRARESAEHSVKAWWSTRPPGTENLDDLDAEVQVAAQVKLCNEAIRWQFSQFPERQVISITYEQLCSSPRAVFEAIDGKLAAMTEQLPCQRSYNGPEAFRVSTSSGIEHSELTRLKEAWAAAEDFKLPDWRNA